jgi:hypothetical protein
VVQVGGAYVRIRPRVSEEDLRALEALDRLVHELAEAFDRFRATIDVRSRPQDSSTGLGQCSGMTPEAEKEDGSRV